jgi:type IV pilus assembly protein PilC
MFERKLSLQNLIDLCRVMRHNLSAGLTLHHAFRQQAERGSSAVRPLARRVLEAIERGEDLSQALEHEAGIPPLLRAMVKVGEQTGHVPEIFGALERHYQLELKLRRQFWKHSFLPIAQFFLALLLIAGLIYILGVIGQSRGTEPLRIFGLSGTRGAAIFLGVSFGAVVAIWLGGWLFLHGPRHAAPVQAALMKLPALGPCWYAVVMSRFTMALRLTLDSGMSIVKALRLSLEATGNAHFVAQGPVITDLIKSGEPLLEALTKSGLFDEQFLQMVAAAEEGGRVPEMMQHQAEYYHEEAGRRLTTLTRLLSFLIWLIYACFMVYAIFQIAGVYFGALGI